MNDVMSVESEWACDATVVARAREWTARQLLPSLPAGTGERVDDAVLCVSELVANAVKAGSAQVTLVIEVQPDTLIVSLTDDAGGWPELQPTTPFSTHGRGLVIVAALSRSWGATRLDAGKLVWAALDM